jgi:hypothetical protein
MPPDSGVPISVGTSFSPLPNVQAELRTNLPGTISENTEPTVNVRSLVTADGSGRERSNVRVITMRGTGDHNGVARALFFGNSTHSWRALPNYIASADSSSRSAMV